MIAALILASDASGGAPGPADEDWDGTAGAALEVDRLQPSVVNPETTATGTIRPPSPAPTSIVPNATYPIPLNPGARLLSGSAASEYWTLYIELETGHRITQRFLISNAGPGKHHAVAAGHLTEEGRAPYGYENGRRGGKWKLSKDRLFLDIGSSHLDLHRPTGELRITKDKIEIRLFFDFDETAVASQVPGDRLPNNYHVDVLAVAAPTHGTIHAPWMTEPLATSGRTWLAHTWTRREEAEALDRRIEIYGFENGTSFYGIQIHRDKTFDRAWVLATESRPNVVESIINVSSDWNSNDPGDGAAKKPSYALPSGFRFSRGHCSGEITLTKEWLRFDPFASLPEPFRWFVRRKSKPEQVWADARIAVTLCPTPETPSLPDAGETESDSNSKRETEEKTAGRSVAGVASVTFLNPSDSR